MRALALTLSWSVPVIVVAAEERSVRLADRRDVSHSGYAEGEIYVAAEEQHTPNCVKVKYKHFYSLDSHLEVLVP